MWLQETLIVIRLVTSDC